MDTFLGSNLWQSVWIQAVLLNSVLLTIGLLLPRKALTTPGLFHAWFLGIILWSCLGWQGYGVMLVYFSLGTAITYVGKAQKEAKGIAEKRDGARGPENLWGSAAVAALCALGMVIAPHPYWELAYVASIATKLADTMASEIGKAYGKTTYLITTFRTVPPGTEGAVSLEGTVAGLIGSLVLALAAIALGMLHSGFDLGVVIFAAFVATSLESVIGATLQSKVNWLTNEVVNGINTAIGAIVGVVTQILFATFV